MKRIKHLLFALILALSLAAPSSMPLIGTVQTVSAAVKINTENVVLIKGQTKQLKITGTTETVKWTSSNKSVASVTAKGKVTAKKKGTALITANAGGTKYKCKVTVQTPSLSNKTASLTVGDAITLKLNGTNQKITWASSNNSVVTVNSQGKITAIKAGSATITATVLKKKYSCKVTVKNKPAAENPQSGYVWLSATGEKYHKIPNCGKMNPNKARKVTLAEAKAKGYTACSKCF